MGYSDERDYDRGDRGDRGGGDRGYGANGDNGDRERDRDGGRDRRRDRDRDRGGEQEAAIEEAEPREEGGHKKKKKKKHKRSESSVSAERSRYREMRRRKQQQEYLNKNRDGMMGGMGGAQLEGGQRMFWDGFQWVPRSEASEKNDPNNSRKLRRLYLGNLPIHMGVTEDMFTKTLFDTMKERGMCNDIAVNPVMHVWFSRDKGANYGFCEIATIEETDRALQLDGLNMMGTAVSIKRPNDANPQGMVGGMQAGQGMPGMQTGGMLALPAMQVQATTSVIFIEQLLLVDASTAGLAYEDVVEDMNEGCGAHGKLKNVAIVRKEDVPKAPTKLKPGDVYIHCGTPEDATKIMRAMGHRKYDGRPINMKSFDESEWYNIIKPILC